MAVARPGEKPRWCRSEGFGTRLPLDLRVEPDRCQAYPKDEHRPFEADKACEKKLQAPSRNRLMAVANALNPTKWRF